MYYGDHRGQELSLLTADTRFTEDLVSLDFDIKDKNLWIHSIRKAYIGLLILSSLSMYFPKFYRK